MARSRADFGFLTGDLFHAYQWLNPLLFIIKNPKSKISSPPPAQQGEHSQAAEQGGGGFGDDLNRHVVAADE